MKNLKLVLGTILSTLFLFCSTETAKAETYFPNEISLGYSQFTIPQTVYIFGGVLGVAFSLGHFQFDSPSMYGAASFEYVHYVNNWLGFGGLAIADYMSAKTYKTENDEKVYDGGKFDLGFASIMPVVKFRWFNNPHFGMYSKLGAGLGYVFTNEEDPFAWSAQISPVCLEFGGISFRGFIELGIGMQGIATFGIKWSL